MPWIVGIDEAGYGPNLGPFVMSAAAIRVSDELAHACLWQVLGAWVRRQAGPDDGRLLVDDSKLVYAAGLKRLETGVLAACLPASRPESLADFLQRLGALGREELQREAWYTGQTVLPLEASPERCARFREQSADDRIRWSLPCPVIVCPAQFNDVLERTDNKGAILSRCLGQLLRQVLAADDTEAMVIHIDKHGGRNFYGPLLQDLLGQGVVRALEEGARRSVYEVQGLARPLRLTFQPEADGEHFCVALASMVSKYLREVLMLEFNRFWRRHVPGLKPTAGYPQDAKRFWKAIQPTVTTLGMDRRTLWREK
jgi:ribonuclease HII